MTTQSTALRMADNIAKAPFLWPGMYERFAVTDDGGTLCSDCCKTERKQIGTCVKGDGWCVVDDWSVDCLNEPIQCSHCGKQIG